MSDKRPVRLALLGCGGHSKLHHAAPLAHYASLHPDRLELAAACDRDRQRLDEVVERFGFAAGYTDMDEMLAKVAPDAVVCVMPLKLIPPMAIDLLKRGVTCTIEKPLGATIDLARELADVAEQTRTPHMVSVNRCHWPLLVRALEWIADRPPLRVIRASMLRNNRTEPQFIWGTGIHPMDTLLHLGGPVASWDACRLSGDELTSPWYSVALDFESGVRGELTVLPTSGRCEESYELFGEGWSARVAMLAESMDGEEVFTLQCWQGGRVVLEDRIAEPDKPWLGFGAYGEVCALVDALREGKPLGPTVAHVMQATEICFEIAKRFG